MLVYTNAITASSKAQIKFTNELMNTILAKVALPPKLLCLGLFLEVFEAPANNLRIVSDN